MMGKRIMRKNLNLALNSVALGVAVFGACTSLYSQHLAGIRLRPEFTYKAPTKKDDQKLHGWV